MQRESGNDTSQHCRGMKICSSANGSTGRSSSAATSSSSSSGCLLIGTATSNLTRRSDHHEPSKNRGATVVLCPFPVGARRWVALSSLRNAPSVPETLADSACLIFDPPSERNGFLLTDAAPGRRRFANEEEKGARGRKFEKLEKLSIPVAGLCTLVGISSPPLSLRP